MILILIWSVIPDFSEVWVGLMQDFDLMALIHRVLVCMPCFESKFGGFFSVDYVRAFLSLSPELIEVFVHASITEGDTESNVN